MEFLSNLFGRRSKEDVQLPTLTLPAFADYPVTQSLEKQILSGLAGQGIGYGDDFVSKSTSPMIAQLKADFPDVQRASAEAFSGRGLGRSSLAAREQGELQAQQNRDINSLIAQATLQNLQQQKADESRYQNLGMQFGQQQSGTNLQNQQMLQNQAVQQMALNEQVNAANQQAANFAMGLPLAIGSAIATDNIAPALSAFGISSGDTFGKTNLIEMLRDSLRSKAFTGETPGITSSNLSDKWRL